MGVELEDADIFVLLCVGFYAADTDGVLTAEQDDDGMPPHSRLQVAVAMARMEAKLDVAIAQHSAKLDEHSRDIVDLRGTTERTLVRVGALEQD